MKPEQLEALAVQASNSGGGFGIDGTTLILGIFFGGVGYILWRFGRKNNSARHMLIAIALMIFPYFVSNVWASVLIGGSLIVLAFWP